MKGEYLKQLPSGVQDKIYGHYLEKQRDYHTDIYKSKKLISDAMKNDKPLVQGQTYKHGERFKTHFKLRVNNPGEQYDALKKHRPHRVRNTSRIEMIKGRVGTQTYPKGLKGLKPIQPPLKKGEYRINRIIKMN